MMIQSLYIFMLLSDKTNEIDDFLPTVMWLVSWFVNYLDYCNMEVEYQRLINFRLGSFAVFVLWSYHLFLLFLRQVNKTEFKKFKLHRLNDDERLPEYTADHHAVCTALTADHLVFCEWQ